MKKLLFIASMILLLATACNSANKNINTSIQPSTTPTTVSNIPDSNHKQYELYEGPIWSSQPKNCFWDLSCVEQAAQTCSPAKGTFVTKYMSDSGQKINEEYQLGIQGTKFGKCQIYFNIWVTDYLPKEVKDNPIPLDDGGTRNYTMCRFDNGSDFATLLKTEPTNSHYDGFIDGSGQLHTNADGVEYYTIVDGISQTKTLPAKCFSHAYLDAFNKINSVRYDLVKSEGIENASSNFRVVVQDMNWPNSATFLVIKDGEQKTINITKNQEVKVFTYRIKVVDFGQKNVEAINLNNSTNSDSGIFEPMVSFVVSQ